MLVYAALNTNNPELWFVLSLLAFVFCITAVLWFGSIVSYSRKDAAAKLKDNFLVEREKILLNAEREKSKLIEKNHKQIIKNRNRSEAKASAKAGLSFLSVIVLGLLMVFTQFFTIGMFLISTASGALAGYAFRTRQDYLAHKKLRANDNALLPRKEDNPTTMLQKIFRKK